MKVARKTDAHAVYAKRRQSDLRIPHRGSR